MYRILRGDKHCDGDYVSKAIAELSLKIWKHRNPKSNFTIVKLDDMAIRTATDFWKESKKSKTILY